MISAGVFEKAQVHFHGLDSPDLGRVPAQRIIAREAVRAAMLKTARRAKSRRFS